MIWYGVIYILCRRMQLLNVICIICIILVVSDCLLLSHYLLSQWDKKSEDMA